MSADQAALARLAYLRDVAHLEQYAAEMLRIRDKDGFTVPLKFSRTQRFVHAALEDQRRRTGKVRKIIGKGRQTHVSTYIGARFYHRTSLNRGTQTYILTHEQPATDKLFEMVERFQAHNPLAPHAGAANAKELVFDLLDSGYMVGTAGTKALGRSSTNQLLHWSEVAFSPNAAGHNAGIVQTVPDRPGTEIIKESTGNGPSGEFFEAWQQAQGGAGDYETLFVPWFWNEEYQRPAPPGFECDEEERFYKAAHGLSEAQMCWRRAKLAELRDPILFKQEYPATANEMFESTSHASFITPHSVLAARKATLEGVGPLVVGADPARFGDDRFSLAWRRGRKVSKVESRLKIGTAEALAWLRDVIDRDKPARMFIDAGGGGDRLFDMLQAWGKPYEDVVVLVNFGSRPQTELLIENDGTKRAGPANRRAEMWMRSRDWLEQEGGADIPDSDSLQADAISPGYSYSLTDQRLVIEAKEKLRARGVRSSDEWDAVVLTFAEPVKERREPPKPTVRTIQTGATASQGWMGA
jgi:hypothetical protein